MQGIAHIPILCAAKLVEIPTTGRFSLWAHSFQRIPVNLTESGGIRPELWRDALRKRPRRQAVQLLQNARTRPVELSVIFEDDINRRKTKHRIASDSFDLWQPKQCCGQWIGNLVFDVLRRASHPLGKDNLLVLADVRYGIDWHRVAGENVGLPIERRYGHAPKHENDREENDDQLALQTEADQAIDRAR